MTATFWAGSSLSFTNGSKTVTVNTGPSLDSVKANSSLTAGSYNEPVEVKSVSGNIITLYNNWPGSTGTTSATIKPSAAAAASAGVAAQQLITEIQNLVGSASATATANSFVKRDSNGRIKAASPSSNDDVVTKGYLGTAATKNVGTDAGNVMLVGAFGHGTSSPESISDYNLLDKGGIYGDQSLSTDNQPAARRHAVQVIPRTESSLVQHAYPIDSGFAEYQHFARLKNAQGFQDWVEYYHSGNANFNEFMGGNADIIATGWVNGPTQALLFFPLNSNQAPSSMSIQSGSTFIIDDANGTPIGAPSNLQLLATSSNRVAIVSCTIPTTSLSEGFPVRLEITSSNASITFNF